MAKRKTKAKVKSGKKTKPMDNTGANVGYEADLWRMADALRGSMAAIGKLFADRLVPSELGEIPRGGK